MSTTTNAIELDEIQGNIFGGFNKDYQAFIFLSVTDAGEAKKFFAEKIFPDVESSTTKHVLAFNNQFKQLKRAGLPEGIITATWTNICFTHRGLKALGLPAQQLAGFSQEFQEGMRARAGIIGDLGPSAPANWYKKYGTDYDKIHAIVLVGADCLADLHSRIAHYTTLAPPGIDVLFVQQGRTSAL